MATQNGPVDGPVDLHEENKWFQNRPADGNSKLVQIEFITFKQDNKTMHQTQESGVFYIFVFFSNTRSQIHV